MKRSQFKSIKLTLTFLNIKEPLRISPFGLDCEHSLALFLLEGFMELKTKSGVSFYIDYKDYQRVKYFSWHISNGYVRTVLSHNNKKVNLSLHTLIMSAKDGQIIDHIDRDRLNNRKSNLRFCNNSQNHKNVNPRGRVIYLGVSIHTSQRKYISKRTGKIKIHHSKPKFLAHIKANGKYIHLGLFETDIEAAKAYDKAAEVYHGEFANLNFKNG